MEILILPTINNLLDDLGIDESEDYNVDALLFRQGFESYPMEIEDGEKFLIPDGYIGNIIDDGKAYLRKIEISGGVYEEEEIYSLEAGSYILNDNVINYVFDDYYKYDF